MKNSNEVKARRNPFQCTDAEALKAYETALQNYSRHAKAKIEAFKNESANVSK